MRKVVLMMHVSLDGFVARENGDLDWVFGDIDDEMKKWTVDLLRPMETQLLGRGAYSEQVQYWPTATDELAPVINAATKIVFSATLDTVEWQNARLARGDVEDEIARLKAEPGGDVFVPGGARFAQSLSARRLIDEYHLVVHPVALGTGMPLFTEPAELSLIGSRAFATGAVALAYERA
jgi:dihydrofolate reductase